MRRLAFVALLATAGLTACFNPDEPPCSFACGPMGECPDDYMCQADGYCHKNGDNSTCGFSDAAVPADMAEPPDLSVQDAMPADGGPDLAQPPDGMPSDGGPKTWTVEVGQNSSGSAALSFNPSSLTIKAGDTVNWVWFNGTHNVTSTGAISGTCSADGQFASGTLSSSGDMFSHTFSTTGTFSYFCSIHQCATMSGTVTVQ